MFIQWDSPNCSIYIIWVCVRRNSRDKMWHKNKAGFAHLGYNETKWHLVALISSDTVKLESSWTDKGSFVHWNPSGQWLHHNMLYGLELWFSSRWLKWMSSWRPLGSYSSSCIICMNKSSSLQLIKLHQGRTRTVKTSCGLCHIMMRFCASMLWGRLFWSGSRLDSL